MKKGYVFEVKVKLGTEYCYIFAGSPKEAKEEFLKLSPEKKVSKVEKRSKKVAADQVKNTCINL